MSRRGFTLLEVLVALAISAAAGVVLVAAYINVLNAYDVVGRSNQRDQDIAFARGILLAEPDRKKAEDGGDFDTADGGHLRWRATIDPTDLADLFRVTFVCELSAPPGPRPPPPPVTEQFMLLRPTWSEGIDTAALRQKAKERITEIQEKKNL